MALSLKSFGFECLRMSESFITLKLLIIIGMLQLNIYIIHLPSTLVKFGCSSKTNDNHIDDWNQKEVEIPTVSLKLSIVVILLLTQDNNGQQRHA